MFPRALLLSIGVFCGCAERAVGPPPPAPLTLEGPLADLEHDRQLLLRRTELYAGGLSADWPIAAEQVAKCEETEKLLARVAGRYVAIRTAALDRAEQDARAALERFRADARRAAEHAAAHVFAAATTPAEDPTALLARLRVQLGLLRLVRGEADPDYRLALRALEELSRRLRPPPAEAPSHPGGRELELRQTSAARESS